MRFIGVLLGLSIVMLSAGIFKPDGLPGIETEVNGNHARFITSPAGISKTPAAASIDYNSGRAQTLWVDRNHQYAVAQHIGIAGNGMWIQAGWWLNAKRTSLYRTLGSATPSWVWPMPGTEWYIPVDVSLTGDDIAVGAGGEPFGSFTSSSPAPRWLYNLPGGYKVASAYGSTVAVSDDGQIYACAATVGTVGKIFLFNSSGDTIRTINYTPNSGTQGIDMSTDGSVICLTTYYAIYIFNFDGTRRDSLYNYGQTAAAISGDGKYVVRGDFSSQVYLFRWSGSAYVQKWQHATGHPWVTSVAISDDGSTIMAGTFQYSPANAGKVLMYDSSSAAPLWEYAQYGDYVCSCALTANGGRGVAGSWGQYGGTFGDVLTVFNKSSSSPIFQLLDDIDEPGSIFCVDISKDGYFATAGGKAVHAREMGNGGEVYAIRIQDPLANDVGVMDVPAPGALLQTGQSITPQAVVKNFGVATATFNTVCQIYDSLAQLIYVDTLMVSNLASDSTRTLNFTPNWTVPAYGRYQTKAYTTLAGDLSPANDTFVRGSICYHDGAVTAVFYPFTEITVNYSKAPRITIANKGSYAENIPAVCQIYHSSNLVYTGNASVYISPLSSATVLMSPDWAPSDTGLYLVNFFTTVSQDYVPDNDSLATSTIVTTEILYDDGFLNTYGYVSSDYYDNKFAVRMRPCLSPPYLITRARFYVSANNPILMSLNADSSGLPGIDPAYEIAPQETLAASGAGWLVKDYASPIPMANSDQFWMVVHWLSTSPAAPYIGMDNNWPIDSGSYWYWSNESNQPGWHAWLSYDFMMRVLTLPQIGAVEQNPGNIGVFAFLAPRPNPFNRQTELTFSIPRDGRLNIRMYDVTGRLVLSRVEPVQAGAMRMFLSNRDDQNRIMASGIYFLNAEYEGRSSTRKVILIKE
jgi:hypothetical protein